MEEMSKTAYQDQMDVIGKRIADIDQTIVAKLSEREKLTLDVERLKRSQGLTIYRGEVEDVRLKYVEGLADKFGLSRDFIRALFYFIIDESSKRQMIQRESECNI